MASSSASLFKTPIPSDLFLTSSLPTTTLSPKIPLLSLSSKPSFTLSLSIKKKLTFQQNIVPFVAQTSDWAQQEEESQEFSEEEETQEVSEEEGEGKDILAEAIREGEEAGEDYEDPPEDAKLFVGNLPFDVDSESLAQLFNKAGTVDIAEVIYNRETGQSRGFGFVTLSTVEEAERAVEMFSRYDIDGRLLTVNKAAPRGTRPERAVREFEPSFRIYVGNLPWSVDDSRLEQVFSEHGKVVSARVVYDRDSGRSRGFGFVTMASETELNDAIAALDGQSLDGRAIRVNVAEDKRRF